MTVRPFKADQFANAEMMKDADQRTAPDDGHHEGQSGKGQGEGCFFHIVASISVIMRSILMP